MYDESDNFVASDFGLGMNRQNPRQALSNQCFIVRSNACHVGFVAAAIPSPTASLPPASATPEPSGAPRYWALPPRPRSPVSVCPLLRFAWKRTTKEQGDSASAQPRIR